MADFAAEQLASVGFSTLYEATNSYNLTVSAEFLFTGGANLTNYYLMIGWDSVNTSSTTVWQVTGAPDTSGASSGNPTINASTIRILKSWAA